MPFELKITAASAQELAEQALTLGFLISPELRPGAKAVEPEIIEPEKPKRGPGRPKKGAIIEGEKVADDVHGTGGDAGGGATGNAAGAAGQTGAGNDAADGSAVSGDVEQPAPQDDAAAEVDAVAAEGGADASAASVEPDTRTLKEAGQDGPVRKRVINDYLNACFDDQPTRSAKFRELLDQFGVQALGDLPVAQLTEFEKAVDNAIGAETRAAA